GGRPRAASGFMRPSYESIAEVKGPDPRTLTVTWKEPFINANDLLGASDALLLPRHLLEDAYRSDKATLLDLPYWTSEFIGAGPYRLRDWEAGGDMLLVANDDYVLGRPR